MNIVLLILYHIGIFATGMTILRRLSVQLPILLLVVSAFLLGTLVGVPLTYVLSCLFVTTGYPILWGTIVTVIIGGAFTIMFRKGGNKNYVTKDQKLMLGDAALIVFSLVFSTWLMFKTFHGGSGGELYVGSNNVFDFGLAVGLMHSISWGSNIPFGSPFFAGLPLFYHFFFIFWASLWEYFGVPTVWAINIPSILTFSSLLIIVYLLPQLLFKQGKLAGWVAVLLTVTNSTLTVWMLLIKNGLSIQTFRDIWRLPTYPFAGPYDGSTISLFMTLNNYVNQRHLAFAIAVSFCLIILIFQLKRRPMILIGLLTGLLLLWNVAVCFLAGAIIFLLVIGKKEWKETFLFTVAFVGGVCLSIIPYLPIFTDVVKFLTILNIPRHSGANSPSWSALSYWWQNLSLLPIAIVLGFLVLPKRDRSIAKIFLFLFLVLCVVAAIGHRGFDQKFLSFLIIPVNVIASVGIVWLWQKSQIAKVLAVILLGVLTISGAVDLMAVKNEFAYPLIGKDMVPLISWIRGNTPKNAVFVSYADMIDPVVLSGRTNYFGFFGNVGWYDRSSTVRQVYDGNTMAAKGNNISYLLVPKWQKNDFPYTVDMKLLEATYVTAYEDEKFLIFRTGVK